MTYFMFFLNERMEKLGEIPGIGEKTLKKIHDHFLEELEGGE